MSGIKRMGKKVCLLFGMLVVTGLLNGCHSSDSDKHDSFVVYTKNDGIYYTYLTEGNKTEQRIQEGTEFSNPMISQDGKFVAYQKEKELYLYTLSTNQYQKLADMEWYKNYVWLEEKLVYADESAGFYLYDTQSSQTIKYEDDNYYENFKVSKDGKLYAKQKKNWQTSEGDFSRPVAIVEIDTTALQNKQIQTTVLIEAKAPESNTVGLEYNPTVSKISQDGRYLFIHEKFRSGSTSADYAGFGVYDTKEKRHIDFTDIYNQRGEENDLVVLPYEDNVALSPKENDLLALIKGGGRELFFDKQLILMKLQDDGTYDLKSIMPDNFLSMTPSFTLDGKELIFSAIEIENSKSDVNNSESYDTVKNAWDTKPHHIYRYDITTETVDKITDEETFDYMPIALTEDDILFFRSEQHEWANHTGSLIQNKNGKETMVVSGVCVEYQPSEKIAVFIGNDFR